MATKRSGIQRAVDAIGSQRQLAARISEHCGTTIHASRVCIWTKNGYVPKKRAALVAAVTGVPLELLIRSTPRRKPITNGKASH